MVLEWNAIDFNPLCSCFFIFVQIITEFDGGDGQMGVAGDGKKGLEKEWKGAAQLAKSKTMSAKNAWGRSTGYAESLMDKGVEATRAQQLENWHNQQDVLQARKQQRFMTDEFDQVSKDENWRSLSKFGAERNQVCACTHAGFGNNIIF